MRLSEAFSASDLEGLAWSYESEARQWIAMKFVESGGELPAAGDLLDWLVKRAAWDGELGPYWKQTSTR